MHGVIVGTDVISGYVCAGKATLLNRILTDSHGLPIGVLVHDFGSLNIDAQLIAAHEGHSGANLLSPKLPPVDTLIADKGCDSDEFRHASAVRKIKACIASNRNRKLQHAFDKHRYKTRHKIENMFGKLKDWRRISTCCDRCAHTLFSAICIAARLTLVTRLRGSSVSMLGTEFLWT
ncbi:MAG: hypothetical protein NTU78_17085 [Alphaproteobacteria bacterium]|nr:hypothetical protein [Alphaproteobacteria bacterium]